MKVHNYIIEEWQWELNIFKLSRWLMSLGVVAGWFCLLRMRLEFVFEGDCLCSKYFGMASLVKMKMYQYYNVVTVIDQQFGTDYMLNRELLEERGLEKLRKESWKK